MYELKKNIITWPGRVDNQKFVNTLYPISLLTLKNGIQDAVYNYILFVQYRYTSTYSLVDTNVIEIC